MATWDVFFQGAILFLCLGLGVRVGGVGVGLFGGIGVLALSALFGLKPGNLPVAAMTIIFSVVTAAGALQLAGGLDYLVSIAQRILKSKPRYITYLSPYVSWLFTIGAGTGNIYYSLLPVIEEVSFSNKIRPERPLAVSTEASQMGVTSSPVSAAMAIMITLLAPKDFGLMNILSLVVPGTLVGIFVAASLQNRLGKDLEADPHYQALLAKKAATLQGRDVGDLSKKVTPQGKRATWIFLASVVVIVVAGFVPQIRPAIVDQIQGTSAPMSMAQFIAVVMMLAGVLIAVVGRVAAKEVPQTPVFQAGMVSVLALMGVAWMANTFVDAHKETLGGLISVLLQDHLWLLPVAFYVAGAMTTSQSTSTLMVVPLALAADIPPQYIVASWLGTMGVHFFPANGGQIAAVQFDRTETTRIGKWVLNHSFMIPNLVICATGVATAFFLAKLMF